MSNVCENEQNCLKSAKDWGQNGHILPRINKIKLGKGSKVS